MHYQKDIAYFESRNEHLYYPLHTPYLDFSARVMLVHSGSSSMMVNGNSIQLTSHSLLLQSANYLVEHLSFSDDFRACSLQISEEMRASDAFLSQITSKVFSILHETGSCTLSLMQTDYERLKTNMQTIAQLIVSPHRYLYKRIQLQCNCLFLDIADTLSTFQLPANNTSHKDLLFKRFYELAIQHFRQEHFIPFYAQKLCITEQYLSRIVRQKTNRTVNQILSEPLIMNAKLLLMNNELTVKQITEELTFNDPTNFSKFFKKHTGFTPMYYRHSCMER